MPATKKRKSNVVPLVVSDDKWLPRFVDTLFPETGEHHEPLIDDLLIRYPKFDLIIGELEDLFKIDRSVLNEHCQLILGESRLGKTRLLAEFIAKHMPFRTPNGLRVSVLYIEVPEKPTIRSIAAEILSQFGEKAGKKDTAEEILDAIVELGANCGVVIVCLDDMHHFVDQRGQVGQYELTEWLKRLVIRMRVALVISGLPRTEEAIRLNEQLYGRMDSKLLLSRFDWRKQSDRAQFEQIVIGVCDRLCKTFKVQKAVIGATFRWYAGCSGRLGYLVKIVRRAIKAAKRSGTGEITLDMLHSAWLRTVFDAESIPDIECPFSPTYACAADDAAVKKIMAFGVELGSRDALKAGSGKRTSGRRSGSAKAKKAAVREAVAA